jgi:hypothetical protein
MTIQNKKQEKKWKKKREKKTTMQMRLQKVRMHNAHKTQMTIFF